MAREAAPQTGELLKSRRRPNSIAEHVCNFTYPDWHNAAYDLCSQSEDLFQKPRVRDP